MIAFFVGVVFFSDGASAAFATAVLLIAVGALFCAPWIIMGDEQ